MFRNVLLCTSRQMQAFPPNFLMRKFSGDGQFLHTFTKLIFHAVRGKLYENSDGNRDFF